MAGAALALALLLSWADLTGASSLGKIGPNRENGVSATALPMPPGWTESPLHRPLFTPPRVAPGTYRTYVTTRPLDEVLREIRTSPSFGGPPGSFEPQSVIASEAFGQSGGYNRWTLARLYGAKRTRVARGPRLEDGHVVEAWTLVSPYPDADLKRLEPGTLLIVLRLR